MRPPARTGGAAVSRAPSPTDRRIALGLGLVAFAVLWATERPVGFVRDESVYFAAAEQFSRWWSLLFHRPAAALSDAVITQAFDFNHEHPMLMKSLFGWSHALFHGMLGWVRPAAGFRLPAFAVAALIPALLHAWGSALWGRRAGLFAAVSFFLVPRQFFHAHLACFDMPVAAMWLLVVYLFWRAQEDLRFAPWTGLAFGLALATKHNAFFLPVVLTPFGVLAAWRVGGRGRTPGAPPDGRGRGRLRRLPVLLLVVEGRDGLVKSWQLLSPQTFGVVALVAGACDARRSSSAARDPARLRPARAARGDGTPRAGRLLRALAVALVPPGGPAGLVLRLPRHARPLRLDVLRRRAACAAVPAALRLRHHRAHPARLAAAPDGRGAAPHRAAHASATSSRRWDAGSGQAAGPSGCSA